MRLLSGLLTLFALLLARPAHADPTFPELTGRVVDAANIIPADEKARLEQKLTALQTQSGRQLVVATVPSLQGYEISDYGYQLGRSWGIGAKDKNDGAILLVAPTERKVRIEVGYGLEGTVTDGISFLIINQQILPRFKAGDMPGGIEAGTDALIRQLTLPADQAQQVARQADAAQARSRQRGRNSGAPFMALVPLLLIGFFVVMPLLTNRGGRRSWFGSGMGPLILWDALNSSNRGGGGWGGGSDWGGGGGGGGGFSGGGGSFGGGGSSGSW